MVKHNTSISISPVMLAELDAWRNVGPEPRSRSAIIREALAHWFAARRASTVLVPPRTAA